MNSNKTKNIERRGFNTELRVEDSETRSVTGYASIFNSRSENLGGFTEIIAPGAFDEAVKNSDVRALLNHDDNKLLARTSSGTLELSIDETGLKYRFEAPNTTAGNDLLEMLKRGDMNQSSFGFTISEDGETWDKSGDQWTRTVTKVNRLFDVSPVTYPAYPDTSVAQRSLKNLQTEQTKPVFNKELLEAQKEYIKSL